MAISAPDRLPAKPGLMYSPPVQSVMLVYWCFLRAVGPEIELPKVSNPADYLGLLSGLSSRVKPSQVKWR